MREINEPDKNQKQEKFFRHDKLALIVTNSIYDVKQMGMKSLPHVVNDRKNMKHTIKNLLNIPE